MNISGSDLLSHKPRVCRMGGVKHGEDLFQDVCVAVVRRSNDSFRSLEAMMVHIAHQRLTDLYRREKFRRHEPLPDDPIASKHLILNDDPSEGLERGEEYQRFRDAISKLELKYREVIEAVCRHESTVEAANCLGIPIGTFWTRFRKAKTIIRSLLEHKGRDSR